VQQQDRSPQGGAAPPLEDPGGPHGDRQGGEDVHDEHGAGRDREGHREEEGHGVRVGGDDPAVGLERMDDGAGAGTECALKEEPRLPDVADLVPEQRRRGPMERKTQKERRKRHEETAIVVRPAQAGHSRRSSTGRPDP